jgi:hypothetical protein
LDKIMSARLDEAAVPEMDRVTRELKISKKRFLEEAIHHHARTLTQSSRGDDCTVGFGCMETQRGSCSDREKSPRSLRPVSVTVSPLMAVRAYID